MQHAGKNARGYDIETCGHICRKCKGGKECYYFTGPVTGLKTEEQIKKAEQAWKKKGFDYHIGGACDPLTAPKCQKGDKHVADYHSHPGGSKMNGADKDWAKGQQRDHYVARDLPGPDKVDIYDYEADKVVSTQKLPKAPIPTTSFP
jgi:hypothetical protein